MNPHLSFPSFYAGAGPVGGGLMTTGVSVEESSFLDEFMACDFSRDRSNLGSLADLSSVSGSLTELDNLPRPATRCPFTINQNLLKTFCTLKIRNNFVSEELRMLMLSNARRL